MSNMQFKMYINEMYNNEKSNVRESIQIISFPVSQKSNYYLLHYNYYNYFPGTMAMYSI